MPQRFLTPSLKHDLCYFYIIFEGKSHEELPSTSAQGAGSSKEHHSTETQVLTRHQRVVIWVGETGEVWGHVIHLHPHVHNLPKARQTLQLAVVDVVEAKAIEQEHQELAVGRGGGGERQEGGEGGGEEGGEEATASHGGQRCQGRVGQEQGICSSFGAGPGTAVLPPASTARVKATALPRVRRGRGRSQVNCKQMINFHPASERREELGTSQLQTKCFAVMGKTQRKSYRSL